MCSKFCAFDFVQMHCVLFFRDRYSVSDAWVVQSHYPKCEPWWHKKGRHNCSSALLRICASENPEVHPMCSDHEPFRWTALRAIHDTGAHWAGTHAGVRMRAEILSLKITEADVIFVDECQDVDAQFIRILKSQNK